MDMTEMARQLKKAYAELEDCGVCVGDAKDYFDSVRNRVEILAMEAEKWLEVENKSTSG